MILGVSANNDSFRTVGFRPGLNVVLAERTKDSTRKDSRNGLGKSMLVEVIHFCLGAEAHGGRGLLIPPLKGWAFSLDLIVGGRRLRATRYVDEPRRVLVEGESEGLPLPSRSQRSLLVGSQVEVRDWTRLLGHLVFGLEIEPAEGKYQPTFRSLVSYFIRHDRDAFSIPFAHHRKQAEADIQVQVAFLLGLAWQDARDVQLLKDKSKGLAGLRRAIRAGVLEGYEQSRGDLEARHIRLQEKARVEAERLVTFKVHPQYIEVRERANELTAQIHALANRAVATRQLLGVYDKDLDQEQAPGEERIGRVYAEAGAELPERVVRRLDDVRAFHRAVVRNRREFLLEEVERLRQGIADLESETAAMSDTRVGLLEVLHTHGALEEFTALQRLHLDTLEQVKRIESLIENWRQLESAAGQIRVEQELLQQRGRRDYEERAEIRGQAIRLFDANSEALYSAPGRLRIDFRPKGFEFGVEIERSGSHGVENMKVFSFDLMLAQLWSAKSFRPAFLVHDSRIFDGVDERQKALALQLAAREAETRGFQYVCSLNSDDVPWREFEPGFDFKGYVRLTLTDAAPAGSLFGFRF